MGWSAVNNPRKILDAARREILAALKERGDTMACACFAAGAWTAPPDEPGLRNLEARVGSPSSQGYLQACRDLTDFASWHDPQDAGLRRFVTITGGVNGRVSLYPVLWPGAGNFPKLLKDPAHAQHMEEQRDWINAHKALQTGFQNFAGVSAEGYSASEQDADWATARAAAVAALAHPGPGWIQEPGPLLGRFGAIDVLGDEWTVAAAYQKLCRATFNLAGLGGRSLSAAWIVVRAAPALWSAAVQEHFNFTFALNGVQQGDPRLSSAAADVGAFEMREFMVTSVWIQPVTNLAAFALGSTNTVDLVYDDDETADPTAWSTPASQADYSNGWPDTGEGELQCSLVMEFDDWEFHE